MGRESSKYRADGIPQIDEYPFSIDGLKNNYKYQYAYPNQTMPSRVWIAEGIGMVKQESYNKSGKLMASSVLTAYSL